MSAEYTAAMGTLKEMFPKHSNKLIDKILRECKGDVENAIARLLQVKPDLESGSSSRQRKDTSKSGSESQQSSKHIFPRDFLRWPKDVEWQRVSSDMFGALPLQTDDDVIASGPPMGDLLSGMQPEKTLQTAAFSPGDQQSGWAKLKSKFMKMRPGYTNI